MAEDVEKAVKKIVADVFKISEEKISRNSSLWELGIHLDISSKLDLEERLESRFQLYLGDLEINRKTYIGGIVAYIEEQLEKKREDNRESAMGCRIIGIILILFIFVLLLYKN